jgi:hypothetical protein
MAGLVEPAASGEHQVSIIHAQVLRQSERLHRDDPGQGTIREPRRSGRDHGPPRRGHWLKVGIELSDGQALLNSVLTVGQSDWATGPWEGDPSDMWLRVTVVSEVLRIQASIDRRRWPLVRLCPVPIADRYMVGPMCCTPERAGLEVLFSDFAVGAPSGKDLHDLS